MNKRGSIVGYTAVALAALTGFAGFAIDLQHLWLVQSRMKTALDAAALAAARDMDSASRDANARATFLANLDPRGGTSSALGATVSTPTVAQEGDNQVRVTATATVPRSLFRIFSAEASTFTDSSVAHRAATGLELAVVLDQTGSMGGTDSATGKTKIEAAKAAVRTMLEVLYGSRDTQPHLWVSLVPFARTINIGTANTAMLDTSAMPSGWSQAAWSGCVEARRNGEDITETNPTTPQGKFRPYFWRSTYRQHGTYPNNCTSSQAYGAVNGTRWCMADNDYSTASATISQSHLNTNPHYDSLRDDGAPEPVFGPNTLCALNPIQPLTASKAAVLQALNAVTAPGRSGGTTIVTGMQGGWFTLSPDWRGWWQNTNGPDAPALPLDYNARHMRKVVVLLSDGDNNWQGATSVLPSRNNNELFYNAYGRLADNRLNITPSTTSYSTTASRADTALDGRWSSVCTAMKNRGITVYVIGFEVASSAHRTLLRNCASSSQHYFESPNASDLQATFRKVGNQLAGLRLSE